MSVEALVNIGKPAVPDLLAALKDKTGRIYRYTAKDTYSINKIRACSAEALGRIQDERALTPLLGALKDENDSVREHAAIGLGYLKNTKALYPLINALRDKETRVRSAAAVALGRMGEVLGREDDERAFNALIRARETAYEMHVKRDPIIRAIGHYNNFLAISR